MKPKITFESAPYVDGKTGCIVPDYLRFTMLVNGKRWMGWFTHKKNLQAWAIETARDGIVRAKKFPREIEVDLGADPEALIHELSYIAEGTVRPEWVN
jgi:hypothetical protein